MHAMTPLPPQVCKSPACVVQISIEQNRDSRTRAGKTSGLPQVMYVVMYVSQFGLFRPAHALYESWNSLGKGDVQVWHKARRGRWGHGQEYVADGTQLGHTGMGKVGGRQQGMPKGGGSDGQMVWKYGISGSLAHLTTTVSLKAGEGGQGDEINGQMYTRVQSVSCCTAACC